MSSLYDILELPKYASITEVRTAFKRLAVKYHPDRNPGRPELEEKFKELSNAYTILGDEDSKRDYDIRLSGIFSQVNQVDKKEEEKKRRKEMVAEMLRRKEQQEKDKIISDWEKVRNGTPLWIRRLLNYMVIAVGIQFIFRNWFYTRESFFPFSYVLAVVFILTGNILEQNLNYTKYLYKNLKGQIRFNLYNRLVFNFLTGIVLSVCIGIGSAHLMALYHFKNYPAITTGTVHVIMLSRNPADMRIVYTYRVDGKDYTKDVPERLHEEAIRMQKVSVRYSYADPVFARIIEEE